MSTDLSSRLRRSERDLRECAAMSPETRRAGNFLPSVSVVYLDSSLEVRPSVRLRNVARASEWDRISSAGQCFPSRSGHQ